MKISHFQIYNILFGKEVGNLNHFNIYSNYSFCCIAGVLSSDDLCAVFRCHSALGTAGGTRAPETQQQQQLEGCSLSPSMRSAVVMVKHFPRGESTGTQRQ